MLDGIVLTLALAALLGVLWYLWKRQQRLRNKEQHSSMPVFVDGVEDLKVVGHVDDAGHPRVFIDGKPSPSCKSGACSAKPLRYQMRLVAPDGKVAVIKENLEVPRMEIPPPIEYGQPYTLFIDSHPEGESAVISTEQEITAGIPIIVDAPPLPPVSSPNDQ